MADSHVKHHDYHLVDPSPWPLTGAASALLTAIGAVAWMKTSEGGVILLDGVEYLAIENGFDSALKFMKKVNDLCSINDATLVVPITPLSLPQDQLSMLKKEFDRVEILTEKTVEG